MKGIGGAQVWTESAKAHARACEDMHERERIEVESESF